MVPLWQELHNGEAGAAAGKETYAATPADALV
jgi:hypothetical protein